MKRHESGFPEWTCLERKRSFSARLRPTVGSLCRRLTPNPVGFTLIELIFVMAILGLLSFLGFTAYSKYIQKARVAKAIGEIHILQKEITAYEAAYRDFPNTLEDIGRGSIVDPWGNTYEYLKLGPFENMGLARKDVALDPLNTDFDLYSKGRDGATLPPLTAPQSLDDVIRARCGRFVGLGSEY